MIIYKIYTLTHPITNEIRYVGRTQTKLEARLKRHLKAKDKSYRVNWIKSLLDNDLIPNINLICETTSFEHCIELEMFYINKYKELGYNLINMTDGGDGSIGFKHSDESKKIISEKTKLRMQDENQLLNLKNKGLNQWKSKTEQEKLDNILLQPNRKSIAQYDLNNNLIHIFLSLREIERELGYFRASISRNLKCISKSVYGYIWKYV